jgi:uncharacterized protein (TIGR02271 family)
MDELLASGFARSDVNVSSADLAGQADTPTGSTLRSDATHEEGIGASIKHFFTGLFGSDSDEHASRYSEAVSRGNHVLTLTTESEPEVERAADVIERFGPIDIDERHDLSGSAASLGAGAYQPQSASQSSSSRPAASMQSGTAPGSLQGGQDKTLYFGTQDPNDIVPRGTTFQESQAGSLQSDADESLHSSGGNLQGSSSLQGTSSLQGSDDASLGGTIRTGQSLQRETTQTSSGSTSRAIPVVEEELKVGKREVQRGGVRVYSRVVETPVNESVNLREEHVSVERHRVDQPISTTDATAFKEQSIELRESAEEAVVQKSARVVEEVVVGKEVSQRQQNISDTVRHTEVQVENLASDADYYRKHYTSTYASSGASYDDLAPAYSYGSDMRRQYSGRDWDDVESDLKASWDKRSTGGASTWEKMKAAVRHGWDKITPDMDSDDNYYRTHWSSTYGSSGDTYDSYAPAYSYGTQARSKYQGRNWDDVESDLRSDWDTRYPSSGGVSTWDKMKAAVRHGWDKVTS